MIEVLIGKSTLVRISFKVMIGSIKMLKISNLETNKMKIKNWLENSKFKIPTVICSQHSEMTILILNSIDQKLLLIVSCKLVLLFVVILIDIYKQIII